MDSSAVVPVTSHRPPTATSGLSTQADSGALMESTLFRGRHRPESSYWLPLSVLWLRGMEVYGSGRIVA